MEQSEGEQVEEDHEANRGASDSDKGEPSDSQASCAAAPALPLALHPELTEGFFDPNYSTHRNTSQYISVAEGSLPKDYPESLPAATGSPSQCLAQREP